MGVEEPGAQNSSDQLANISYAIKGVGPLRIPLKKEILGRSANRLMAKEKKSFDLFAGISPPPKILRVQWSPTGTAFLLEAMQGWGASRRYGAWIVQVDGTGLRLLSPPDRHGTDPRWTDDGRAILYVEVEGSDERGRPEGPQATYRIPPDGSQKTLVTPGGALGLNWSPDGEWLAWTTPSVSRFDRTDERVLFRFKEGTIREIIWSPSSTRLLFIPFAGSAGNNYVGVVNRDGSGRRKVWEGYWIMGAVWSPDESKIAYWETGGGLYLVNADGTGYNPLGEEVVESTTWAPDGSALAVIQDNKIVLITLGPWDPPSP